MSRVPDDKAWHLDKRVPIALILAISVQTGSAIWWASAISGRVAALEKADDRRSGETSELKGIAVDIAVLKENVKSTKEDVSSMKTTFEALLQQALQEKTRR